jgi:hypothetical protein
MVMTAGAGAAFADTIYCTANGTDLATIDSGTGAGTGVGSTGYYDTWAAAFDTNGDLYTTMYYGQQLGMFDVSTGAVTPIGNLAGSTLIALEIDANGTLFGLDWNGNLYTIDKSTAAQTLVGTGTAYGAMDLAFDSDGTLWAVAGDSLYTIDTTDGSATWEGAISGAGGVMGLMFDENDTLFATSWTGNSPLFTIDTSTFAATFVAYTGLAFAHGGDIFIEPDTDGDGVVDSEDHCVNSDLSATVVIDGCDSGVANDLFSDGCTIIDLVMECADGAVSHGQFVSCVASLLNRLKNEGAITGKEKGAIQSCAAKSNLP